MMHACDSVRGKPLLTLIVACSHVTAVFWCFAECIGIVSQQVHVHCTVFWVVSSVNQHLKLLYYKRTLPQTDQFTQIDSELSCSTRSGRPPRKALSPAVRRQAEPRPRARLRARTMSSEIVRHPGRSAHKRDRRQRSFHRRSTTRTVASAAWKSDRTRNAFFSQRVSVHLYT